MNENLFRILKALSRFKTKYYRSKDIYLHVRVLRGSYSYEEWFEPFEKIIERIPNLGLLDPEWQFKYNVVGVGVEETINTVLTTPKDYSGFIDACRYAAPAPGGFAYSSRFYIDDISATTVEEFKTYDSTYLIHAMREPKRAWRSNLRYISMNIDTLEEILDESKSAVHLVSSNKEMREIVPKLRELMK